MACDVCTEYRRAIKEAMSQPGGNVAEKVRLAGEAHQRNHRDHEDGVRFNVIVDEERARSMQDALVKAYADVLAKQVSDLPWHRRARRRLGRWIYTGI